MEPWRELTPKKTDTNTGGGFVTVLADPFFPAVTYESRRFDWEACPKEYCGGVQEEREDVGKSLELRLSGVSKTDDNRAQ
ncbi:hypothetical protein PT974_05008 [Cladobotryum mycophilum]|uniref:Uncharacterized protein n=1 Tax=Cladobotryum mycophilum TaxID=491253 RepID=A0ABR0SS29_9HYPO